MKSEKKISSSRPEKKALSLDTSPKARSAPIIQIKPGSVFERMGGLPKFMLHGDGNASSRDSRKKVVADQLEAKAARRKAL